MLVAATMPDGLTVVGAISPAEMARRALADIFEAGDQAAAFLVDSSGQMLYQLGAELHAGMNTAQYPWGRGGAPRRKWNHLCLS